jgi:hypothetical protein
MLSKLVTRCGLIRRSTVTGQWYNSDSSAAQGKAIINEVRICDPVAGRLHTCYYWEWSLAGPQAIMSKAAPVLAALMCAVQTRSVTVHRTATTSEATRCCGAAAPTSTSSVYACESVGAFVRNQ